MTTADYNRAIHDALAILAKLHPPKAEPALESLRNIYTGEGAALGRAEVQIRELLKSELDELE